MPLFNVAVAIFFMLFIYAAKVIHFPKQKRAALKIL
jgi:hypothetical protein